MSRITLLAAGNADLRDSLHALREDGAVTWNGINTVLRTIPGAPTARVIHRTFARSDAVLAMPGVLPPALRDRAQPPAPFSPPEQFAPDLFDTPADVVALSIQADVMHALCRHRDDGHLLYPYDLGAWPEPDRDWLRAQYEPVPMLTAEQSMANFADIIARIRARQQPHILIFNLSAAMPWERVRRYRGLAETLGERIRRFNLALVDLARQTGIAIVDVDAVLADAGARTLKLDPLTLTAQGCRLVAEEVVATLQELGALDGAGG